MHKRRIAPALGVVLAVVIGVAGSATAASQLKPRAGHYAGLEAVKPTPLPVSFTVSKNRKRVIGFSGEAVVKAGCKNHLTGFEAPTAPMPISKTGHFSRTSTTYPQRGVAVTVTGRFTSLTKVTGHLTIRFAHVKGCNASRVFTAQRTTAAGAASTPT